MKLVFDADILSTLIKTSRQKLISKVFPNAEVIIPQRVYNELEKGYFKDKKLSKLIVLPNYILDSAKEADIIQILTQGFKTGKHI